MQLKAFRFARLASSQFVTRVEEVNEFLKSVEPIGLPQVAASDEDGTIMFVFFNEKKIEPNNTQNAKPKKD
jgi:hypothetical protein